MKRILHVITDPDCPLCKRIIDYQEKARGAEIKVVDLSRGEVDYDELLSEIFHAESISVW